MRNEKTVIIPVFFLSFALKNLCSFMVRTIECNSYYIFLLFFDNTMQNIFLKNKTASTLVMFHWFISIYEV